MATNKDIESDTGDINRISRDYAVMRLEIMEQSDLLGLSEVDFRDLSNEFHSSQRKLLLSLNRLERTNELEITVKFDTKMKQIKQRFVEMNSIDKKSISNINVNNNEPQVSVKLPKINIKPFDSNLDNWISFIQLYNSLIHNRTNISNVEKLHYLLSSVQGKAYDLIKNYPLTNENYLNAYETLLKYYNRQRQIATAYYEKLLHCEPIKFKTSSELERIYRTFSENLAILDKYKLPDKNFMLFHLLWSKLDKSTREAFQLEQNTEDVHSIPKFEHLQNFIEKHYRALELSSVNSLSLGSKFNPNLYKVGNQLKFKAKSSLLVSNTACVFCKGQHVLAKCENFISLSVKSRFDFVKENRLCLLCFSNNHTLKQCRATYRCEACNYSHHTLLHFDKPKPEAPVVDEKASSSTVLTSIANISHSKTVLFSTAKVLIKDGQGNYQTVRVLLDCASACNFISESCAKWLQLPITKTNQSINGIGHSLAKPLGLSVCEIKPTNSFSSSELKFKALVLSSICADQPSQHINASNWYHIKKLPLADPDFDCPGPIDILLNASIFVSSLLPGLKRGVAGQPCALQTVFGWILMGECNGTDSFHHTRGDCFLITDTSQCNISNLSLDNCIRRFWETESIASLPKILSREDNRCE
ncbi:uncharacterized protein LOC131851744 [Achroia grisella]|uniref:uncharacterized protein LOC131851744 n=1 Tax=Achroia grisella TaxID=688607 RepID=UPI0027D3311C|nr:uncharacterized protein LOC131851744 [Achroia grisella]